MDEVYIGVIKFSDKPSRTVFGQVYPGGIPRLESLRKATGWERFMFRIKSRLGLVPPPGTVPRVLADNVEVVIMAEAPVIEKLYGLSVNCLMSVKPPIEQAKPERCEV
jgi:hypothetical protein